MKKSVRINLLVITIVVTLVVFAGLWYLRPGVSDVILQQARVRQSQPLMEITEPLRKPKAEDLIDTTELSKNLKREIVPSITEAVKAELLADPTFVRSEAKKREYFENAKILARVQENYLGLAARDPARFVIVDALLQKEEVAGFIADEIRTSVRSSRQRPRT